MIDTDAGFPDDVPIADAIDQQRWAAETRLDEHEASTRQTAGGDVPLEASAADWQEQQESVQTDPESEVLE